MSDRKSSGVCVVKEQMKGIKGLLTLDFAWRPVVEGGGVSEPITPQGSSRAREREKEKK